MKWVLASICVIVIFAAGVIGGVGHARGVFQAATNVPWEDFSGAKVQCEAIAQERCVAVGAFVPESYLTQRREEPKGIRL